MQVQSDIPKLIIKTVKKEANPVMQVDSDVSMMGARVKKKKNTTIKGDIPKFTIKPVKEEEKTVTQVEGAVSVMHLT